MTIQIRPYESADFAALEKIHDPARKRELALAGLTEAFLPLSIAAEREGLLDYALYVAQTDGGVEGFIAFTPEEIAWLYVDVCHARQGIGSALLRYALDQMEEDVSVEVLAGNEPALKFYSSHGFQIGETVRGVMPGNEEFPVTVHVLKRA